MSAAQAKQLENAHALLSHLNTLNFDALADLLAPDFTFEYFPASLSPPEGKAKRGKEETLELFKHAWLTVFEYITLLKPIDVIQGSDAVVLHVKSDGMSKSGKKYNNEYMFTFRFAGEKIVYLKEFADSKYSESYFADLTG
ncbi:SnoaL-like domain-containing protein [Mycena venus]|uniref:SnoaL-like domain-containing protein n=1 Tax=Mycena venus TaxID=2733690 RepID=A0A8H6Y869_9AGAR|nr:SnoaL-like domain-containing protein [Mycena venus]